MNFKRIIAGAVTVGLLGITPVALAAAPAQATENLTTTTAAQPSKTKLVYGDDFYVSSAVIKSTGTGTYDGTATLFAMPANSSTWSPVATVTASYSFYDVKPKMNTTYKVVYSGYAATNAYKDNLAASESAPFTVKVARKVKIGKAKAKLTIKGKVKPKYKKNKVKIKRKKGKRWVKHRTIKTNKKSKFKVRLPAAGRGNKIYFKIIIPGNKKYAKYSEVWYTYSYREAITPRVGAIR